MKGPNGKSVILNKATVSISSNIYDRRALDCTDNKALVNALNHLTYLTSSSVKVREAMIYDGAVERLVGILYECKDPKNDTECVTFAWKWVLSLQCLVLAGTKGSEKMRKKMVDAGIIPILATILDNHFLTRKTNIKVTTTNTTSSQAVAASTNNDTTTTSNTAPSIASTETAVSNNNSALQNQGEQTHTESQSQSQTQTQTQIQQQMQESSATTFHQSDSHNHNFQTMHNEPQVYINHLETEGIYDDHIADSLDKMNTFANINKPLCEEELELLNVIELVKCFQKLSDAPLNADVNLIMRNFKEVQEDRILSNDLKRRLEISNLLYPNQDCFEELLGTESLSHTVPRTFENGLILPSTDDVMWSLQLLAFISKYTCLKHPLCNTYLINGLSFRSRNHPPPLENDATSIDLDEVMTDPVENNIHVTGLQSLSENNAILQNERLEKLRKMKDDDDREIIDDYFKILSSNDGVEKMKHLERIRLNSSRIKHESLGKLRNRNKILYRQRLENYAKKWDYNSLSTWNEMETPLECSSLIDKNIQPFVTLNIFPLVERFTVRTWFGADISYWAAVVVRNANRKDEKMGGRRQCANFNCGKWEDHPKQFSKCRRCKRAKYCSRDCQTKAWVFHKHWCVAAESNESTN